MVGSAIGGVVRRTIEGAIIGGVAGTWDAVHEASKLKILTLGAKDDPANAARVQKAIDDAKKRLPYITSLPGSGTVLPNAHGSRSLRNDLYGAGGRLLAPNYTPPKDPFALPGMPGSGSPAVNKPPTSTSHTSLGPISFVINGATNPRATADAVRAVLDDMSAHPRSALAISALYRTAPGIPLPLTVSPAGMIG